MIYTQQRRKELNKATRALFPNIEFHENLNGIPVMECTRLPRGAKRIDSAEDFLEKLNRHSVRINDMGTCMPDYSKVLPVFIRSMKLEGKNVHHYYRVNYVSLSEISKRQAEQYINKGKLYAVM